jgi:predicted ester cyclase
VVPSRSRSAMLHSAFPDHHITIEVMVAEGDKVVMLNTYSGTHEGEFMGIAPTGKRFVQRQVHVMRFVDGKAVEHWGLRDDLGQMQQLGVIPSPEQPQA